MLATVVLLAASGCVTVSTGEGSATRTRPPAAPSGDVSGKQGGRAGGERPDELAREGVALTRTPGDLSVTLEATTQSLREFWTDQLPTVYDLPFQELAGGVQAKTESSATWTCGGQRFGYADIKGNAFYCGGPQDDYIAFDAASLLPQLNEQFGSLTPSVVLAHEMGHAIQARIALDAPSVIREVQADCFAGAWVAFAGNSARDPVTVESSALDSSVRALPALRDQPGTPATNPQAHGLAFDRVNAYQTGYRDGVARCARFAQGDVVVTELPFRTVAEAQSGGDLPYPTTVQFAVDSLDAFWRSALPELAAGATWRSPEPVPVRDGRLPDCPGDDGYDPGAVAAYCTSSDAVAWSDASLARGHASLGDVAAASALSLAWARSGQVQAGIPSSGVGAQLQQVCATGAWLASVGFDTSASFSLSPGDIDEGLFAVLSPLAPGEGEAVVSSSFERADAFRTGLLGGMGSCRAG